MNTTLLQQVKSLIEAGRSHAVRQVNSTISTTYFLVGRYIVEYEQGGGERAGYSEETIKYLAHPLMHTIVICLVSHSLHISSPSNNPVSFGFICTFGVLPEDYYIV